jgi:hypothetical protein
MPKFKIGDQIRMKKTRLAEGANWSFYEQSGDKIFIISSLEKGGTFGSSWYGIKESYTGNEPNWRVDAIDYDFELVIEVEERE